MNEIAAQGRTATVDAAPRVSAGWFDRVRRFSADFWREFMFWWTEHAPIVVLWTGPFFLWFAWRYSRVLRAGTLANAKRLLGPDADEASQVALARSVVNNAYITIYELGRAVRLSREALRACIVDVQGEESYLAARRHGKGAIIVTAHIGSFEVGAAALLDRETRVHVVFRRDEFARFERLRSRLRQRLGVDEAAINDGWSIWMRMRDALLADEVVMIQADRVMPGQKGVPVPFFDGHLPMPVGPIKLALATGAPIIPVFSFRAAVGKVRVVIEEPIFVSRDAACPAGSDVVATALRRLAKIIERQIAAHPDQWLMLEPAWCEDQHGEE